MGDEEGNNSAIRLGEAFALQLSEPSTMVTGLSFCSKVGFCLFDLCMSIRKHLVAGTNRRDTGLCGLLSCAQAWHQWERSQRSFEVRCMQNLFRVVCWKTKAECMWSCLSNTRIAARFTSSTGLSVFRIFSWIWAIFAHSRSLFCSQTYLQHWQDVAHQVNTHEIYLTLNKARSGKSDHCVSGKRN